MNHPGIMVVEDEAIIREDLGQMLMELGYEVRAKARTAEDAISKAEKTRPNLILMDIVLKGDMDGIEAAWQIGERFDIPSIFLTAYADKEKLARAKLSNTFGYIVKPVNESTLSCCIDIALYKHGLQKDMRDEIEIYDSSSALLLNREIRIRALREENLFLKDKLQTLMTCKQGEVK